MIKDKVIVSKIIVHRQTVAVLDAILVRIHRTKLIFDLGRPIVKSNAYMKFERDG